MHIGIDASRASVAHRTGTEGYSLFIIKSLLELKSSHTFTLYFRESPPFDLFPTGDSVRHVVIKQPRLWTHLGLGPTVKKDRPDVLFVPSHVVPWPADSVVPAVVTVHDVGYLHLPDTHPFLQRLYLDWSTRHSARASRKVIAVSRTTANDLAQFKICPPEKIQVIHSGLQDGLSRVIDPQILEKVCTKYSIPGPYILHIGTLRYRKNLHRLVEAFAHLIPRYPDVCLALIGQPDWGYSELLSKISDLNLYGRVIIPGYADQADIAALYSGASVFAFPSLYEGFGFPVLEAMACGTPVVCSKASSLPEIAGEAALFFDPYDVTDIEQAIETVLTDQQKCSSLVTVGYQRLKLFDWNAAARQTLEVLTQAAHDHAN